MQTDKTPVLPVEGIVDGVNERGVRVCGTWWNASKFHPVDLPPLGSQVRLAVKSGWINAVEVLSGSTNGHAAPAVSEINNDLQARCVALTAAATFASSRPEAKSGDVLTLASKYLAWLLEEGQPEPR